MILCIRFSMFQNKICKYNYKIEHNKYDYMNVTKQKDMPFPLLIVVCIVGIIIVAIFIEAIYTIGKNIRINSKVPLSKSEIQLS